LDPPLDDDDLSTTKLLCFNRPSALVDRCTDHRSPECRFNPGLLKGRIDLSDLGKEVAFLLQGLIDH
jgi:hypothetical protein